MRLTFITGAILALLSLASCSTLNPYIGGLGTAMGISDNSSGIVLGQYQVSLVECIGNASAQSVTAVVIITNRGPNDKQFIGGSLNNTIAIDNYGTSYIPYNSAGVLTDLPTGVPVRVNINRIEPVMPGISMFRLLRVSIGGKAKSSVEFRNVPIVWGN